MVPGCVEGVDGTFLEGLEVLFAADQGAGRILGVPEVVGKAGLKGTPLGVAAAAAFLDDDGTLEVELFLLVEYVVSVFTEDEQAAVGHALTLHGDVVEHVLCLLKAGGRVDVAAELGSDALEVVEYALAGEALGAVEAHVLEEVGETVLVGSLEDTSGLGGQIELGPVFGKRVLADVIGESIVELTNLHGGIVRKRLHHRVLGREAQSSESRCEKNKDSFHTAIVDCCIDFLFGLQATASGAGFPPPACGRLCCPSSRSYRVWEWK